VDGADLSLAAKPLEATGGATEGVVKLRIL
jgi:hypothetical protein